MLLTQQVSQVNKIQLQKASKSIQQADYLQGKGITAAAINTFTPLSSIIIKPAPEMSSIKNPSIQEIDPILPIQNIHPYEVSTASPFLPPTQYGITSSQDEQLRYPSFDWECKWLKGDEYAFMLENIDKYCQKFNLKMFPRKTHPEEIYLQPTSIKFKKIIVEIMEKINIFWRETSWVTFIKIIRNGLIYFVEGNCVGSEFGFPRVTFRKQYRWKKMNFTTDLPKKRPEVTYIVASSVRCQKHGQSKSNNIEQKDVYRMHAVILYKVNGGSSKQYILCHIRKIDINNEIEKAFPEASEAQEICFSNELSESQQKLRIANEKDGRVGNIEEEDEEEDLEENRNKRRMSNVSKKNKIEKNKSNNVFCENTQLSTTKDQTAQNQFLELQRKISEGSNKNLGQTHESPTYPVQLKQRGTLPLNLVSQDFLSSSTKNESKQKHITSQRNQPSFENIINKKMKREQHQSLSFNKSEANKAFNQAISPNRSDSSHSSTSNQIKEEENKREQINEEQLKQQTVQNDFNLNPLNFFSSTSSIGNSYNNLSSFPFSQLNQTHPFSQTTNHLMAVQTNLSLQLLLMQKQDLESQQQQQQQQEQITQQHQLQTFLSNNRDLSQNLFNQLTLTNKNQSINELISKVLQMKQPNQEIDYHHLYNLSRQFNFPSSILSSQAGLLQNHNFNCIINRNNNNESNSIHSNNENNSIPQNNNHNNCIGRNNDNNNNANNSNNNQNSNKESSL